MINAAPRARLIIGVDDAEPKDKHLLLMVNKERYEEGRKVVDKFLCGRDERHWFVAAVPERTHASTVQQAKDALKPTFARQAVHNKGIKAKNRDERKNTAYERQGEWFFIPFGPRLLLRTALNRHVLVRPGNRRQHAAVAISPCVRTSKKGT